MTMRHTANAAVAMLVAAAPAARADDWPMWGGSPDRNMVSTEKNIPASFDPGKFKKGSDKIDPATTKNVRWVGKLGSLAYGNPTVANGRVYVGTNNRSPRDSRFEGDYSLLYCFDEKTGEFLWQFTAPKLGAGKVSDWEYVGICSSPAIDGDRVYFASNRCEIVCVDAQALSDGNDGFQKEGQYMAGPSNEPVAVKPSFDADIIWKYDMRKKLGVFPHNITSTSPLVTGGRVYAATANGQDWSHTNIPSPLAPAMIALDKKTGKLVGEENAGISKRVLHSNWSSPTLARFDGKRRIIFGGGDGYCYAFNPKTKKSPRGYSVFPTDWKVDANRPEMRKVLEKEKYPHPKGASDIIATPVYKDGKVYVAVGQDPHHGEGIGNLAAIDVKSGSKVWQYKEIDRTMATAAVHKGLVYIPDYTGIIHCVDAKTGEQVWTHDVLSHIWGSPLVVDGKVFIGNRAGELLVLATGRKKKVLNTINMNSAITSTPIAANGTLYVATGMNLYAVAKQKKGGAAEEASE